jgi:hypothetical protein
MLNDLGSGLDPNFGPSFRALIAESQHDRALSPLSHDTEAVVNAVRAGTGSPQV